MITSTDTEKFKDAKPEETLKRIKNILQQIGIETNETWVEPSIENCFSLRVSICGSDFGTNGKGVNKEFALASGYAEFMERLQTEFYYIGNYSETTNTKYGFFYAPDEKYIDVPEIIKQENTWIDFLLEKLINELKAEKVSFTFMKNQETVQELKEKALLKWKFLQPPGFIDKDFITIPFYDVKKEKLHYIPYSILRSTYGSNGICAGNTPHEALVQGLSEIFERYVNIKIIKEKITPPTIPHDFLKQYPYLYKMINDIESQGNYRVIVKDCSLGKGLPVICVILTDLDQQTYRVKFGAHPSLKIALERSLTEMFQGISLKQAARTNPFFYGLTGIFEPINIQNILKNATGFYPFEFFSETFSYKFKPFMDITNKSNQILLTELLDLLFIEGFDLYIRDVSFLGFPSYHLIVPGASEVYDYDLLTMKERATKYQVEKVMNNLHAAEEDDLKTLALYIRYKFDSVYENTLPFIYRLPLKDNFFGGVESFRFLLVLTLYKLGKQKEAYNELNIIIKRLMFFNNTDLSLLTNLRCMRDYIALQLENIKDSVILKEFYPLNIYNSVIEKLQDPQTVFDHFYQKTNCWDCCNCQAKDNCNYFIVDDVRLKLKKQQHNNYIDQLNNQKILKSVLQQ